MSIPTEDDWRSEPWGIDTPWAYKNFHGKTSEEAIQLFEENAFLYQEDVWYMPKQVFGYYLRAFMAYLASTSAEGDAASCFISLIKYKAQHEPDTLVPLWSEIDSTLQKLADYQEYFEADWLIYGSFRTHIHAIVEAGFKTSFDTTQPEIVPQGCDISQMARGFAYPVALAVAAQVFANSGIPQITAKSTRQEILEILGPPDDARGGPHSKFGNIPDWFRYNRTDCVIRFQCDGSRITSVMFLRRDDDYHSLT